VPRVAQTVNCSVWCELEWVAGGWAGGEWMQVVVVLGRWDVGTLGRWVIDSSVCFVDCLAAR
jgi:hypothetical protein